MHSDTVSGGSTDGSRLVGKKENVIDCRVRGKTPQPVSAASCGHKVAVMMAVMAEVATAARTISNTFLRKKHTAGF